MYMESFNSGAQGFSYKDDTFYGTSNPLYAKGGFAASGGRTGGGLQVVLGGVDYKNISNGMSGGWSDDFPVAVSGMVRISFNYRVVTNRYDDDECGQVMAAVDGKIVRFGGLDYVEKFCGEGDSGWQKATFDINLSSGSHRLTIGAYNNKKTALLETTQVSIDDVSVAQLDTGGTAPPSAGNYTYSDNTFRGTSSGQYASGSTEGGALKVTLGGIDGVDVTNGISGGWKSTVKTTTSGTVRINLRYRLITNRYDGDECGQALVSVNGKLYGLGGNDYLAQRCGAGDTGWKQATLNVSLPAGSHTLIVGGYNNKKTGPNEVTEVLFDNIEVTR